MEKRWPCEAEVGEEGWQGPQWTLESEARPTKVDTRIALGLTSGVVL